MSFPRRLHGATEQRSITSLVLPMSYSYHQELQQLSTPKVNIFI